MQAEEEFCSIRGDLPLSNPSTLRHLVLSEVEISLSAEKTLSEAILQLQSLRISTISRVLNVSFLAIFQSSTLQQVFLSRLRVKTGPISAPPSPLRLISLREVRTSGLQPKRHSPFPKLPALTVLSAVGCSDALNYWVILALPSMKSLQEVEICGFSRDLQPILDVYLPSTGETQRKRIVPK